MGRSAYSSQKRKQGTAGFIRLFAAAFRAGFDFKQFIPLRKAVFTAFPIVDCDEDKDNGKIQDTEICHAVEAETDSGYVKSKI